MLTMFQRYALVVALLCSTVTAQMQASGVDYTVPTPPTNRPTPSPKILQTICLAGYVVDENSLAEGGFYSVLIFDIIVGCGPPNAIITCAK